LPHTVRREQVPEEGQPEYEPGLLYFSDVYHISFFLIINIVLLNVVFGIILDTFAELRGEKARADSAMTHARPFSAKPRGNLARVGGHQGAHGEHLLHMRHRPLHL